MAKKLKVLVLVRDGHVPPEDIAGLSDADMLPWKAEYDVCESLRHIGHQVRPIGVYDDLGPLREALLSWQPDITFMMLEEFHGVSDYDHAIVSYLELMQQPYTGCNPRGLMLSKDKGLSKKLLTFHRLPTPRFAIFPVGRGSAKPNPASIRRPSKLQYPLFVKSTLEDASFGISQASIVHDDEQLRSRVAFVHEKTGGDAIAEEYVDGRELYVGVLGNARLQTFPAWEMSFGTLPDDVARIATSHVKWNLKYQKKHDITTHAAMGLDDATLNRISRVCKRVYRALDMSGYARMDIRMRTDGEIYVLEANANPNIEFGEDFAESAASVGIDYDTLLQRIIRLGLSYRPAWMIS